MQAKLLTKADRELAMKLLEEAIAAAGKKGKAGVAVRLGVSRSLLARIMSPNDKCRLSDDLAGKVIDRYHVIPECPATFQPMPRSDCLRISRSAAPTHNPSSMGIWKCCQTCEHRPEIATAATATAPAAAVATATAATIEEACHAASA